MPTPNSFTPHQKLDILQAAQELQGPELGAFLREKGLHSTDLESWRTEILSALGNKPTNRAHSTRYADKKRIRELEKELRRKEKALAEAAALLILQKKVQALWADEDGPTQLRSEGRS